MKTYLSTQEVMARYRISRSTLARWQDETGVQFPRPIKIGHRTLWREADLVAFDEGIAAD